MREIIKMKAIYELLEAVTDRCLDVANLAEGISLENSLTSTLDDRPRRRWCSWSCWRSRSTS